MTVVKLDREDVFELQIYGSTFYLFFITRYLKFRFGISSCPYPGTSLVTQDLPPLSSFRVAVRE